MSKLREKDFCAIRIKVGDNWEQFEGSSHGEAIAKLMSIKGIVDIDKLDSILKNSKEGFITETNDFVDRDTGMKIAREAEQIKREFKNEEKLDSGMFK